jgi:hypothetical protein
MRLLGSMQLDPPVAAELLPLLLAEIKDPQKGEYPGAHTSAAAIDALSRLPGAARHLDEIVAITEGGYNGFDSGVDALLRLTRDLPDRKSRLEAFVRPRLKEHDGMMNDVFITALALDLRGLAPDIAALASESPAVQDGDAAEYGGGSFKGPAGQRYHIAREITALWNEPDPGNPRPHVAGPDRQPFLPVLPELSDHRCRKGAPRPCRGRPSRTRAGGALPDAGYLPRGHAETCQ